MPLWDRRALALTQVHHGSRLSDSCEDDGEALSSVWSRPRPSRPSGSIKAAPHSSQLTYAPYIRRAKGKARAVAIGATSSQAFEAGSYRSTE